MITDWRMCRSSYIAKREEDIPNPVCYYCFQIVISLKAFQVREISMNTLYALSTFMPIIKDSFNKYELSEGEF